MHRFVFILLSGAMVVSGYAFGVSTGIDTKNAKVSKAKKCMFPKSKKRAPDWVCNAHDDSYELTAVGSFPKSATGIAFMEQMAAADARVHLAEKVRESVHQQIAALEVAEFDDNLLISTICDTQLQGTRVLKSVYGPRGKLYVLMGIDEADAQKLREAIAAEYLVQMRK